MLVEFLEVEWPEVLPDVLAGFVYFIRVLALAGCIQEILSLP